MQRKWPTMVQFVVFLKMYCLFEDWLLVVRITIWWADRRWEIDPLVDLLLVVITFEKFLHWASPDLGTCPFSNSCQVAEHFEEKVTFEKNCPVVWREVCSELFWDSSWIDRTSRTWTSCHLFNLHWSWTSSFVYKYKLQFNHEQLSSGTIRTESEWLIDE